MTLTHRTALLFALPGGLAFFLYFMVVYWAGANPFYSFPQRLVMIPEGILLFFALRYYRGQKEDSTFSFGEGVVHGLYFSLIFGLISSWLIYCYCQYVNPGVVADHIVLLKKYLTANKESLINRSSEAVYNGNVKAAEQVTAMSLAVNELIWKVVRGVMFSILVSLVFRRK